MYSRGEKGSLVSAENTDIESHPVLDCWRKKLNISFVYVFGRFPLDFSCVMATVIHNQVGGKYFVL